MQRMYFVCPTVIEHITGSKMVSRANPTSRIQKPDIPRAGRGRTAHGGAAGRGEAGQDGSPTNRFAKELIVSVALSSIVQNCSERLFRSTNIESPMQTDRKQNQRLTAIYQRLTSGFSAERNRSSFPGAGQ